jgi:hypothetical protein
LGTDEAGEAVGDRVSLGYHIYFHVHVHIVLAITSCGKGPSYFRGSFPRSTHSGRPSWRQRVQGQPRIDASQRTLRWWHQEHALGARLVRRSMAGR